MRKTRKFISLLLATLMIMTSVVTGSAITSNAASYASGDTFIYKYVVQTDSLIDAFEGTLTYPTDDVSISSDEDITVYDGTTGSTDCHASNGTVAFNASNASPIYNFKNGATMLQVKFNVISDNFNPADLSVKIKNIYDDEHYTAHTNNPFGYKHYADDSVVYGGYVDLDNNEDYTTAPEETETTEYVAPTDTIYVDYKVSGGHQFDVYDTPMTNNNDGTYTATISYNGTATTLSLYDQTTGNYFAISKATIKTLTPNGDVETVSLEEKTSRTSLVFNGTTSGSLVLTYNFDTMELSYKLVASEETTEEVTETPTTIAPTTTEEATEAPTTVEPTTTEEVTEVPTTVEPTTTEEVTEAPTTVEPTTVSTDSTFYYVPTQADETSGYTYKAQVKVLQPNGQNKNTYVVLTKTDKTYNGTPIYSLSLNDYTTVTRLTIQTYNGDSWKSQVVVANNTTADEFNNKMYDKTSKTLTDYTVDTDSTFYYVPAKADETAGYIYKAQVKVLQPNGQNKNTYVTLAKADKTYNGTPIYSLSLEGYTTITRLTVQTYDNTTWKSQVVIANDTTASALNNKMYDKTSQDLTDYAVDTDSTFYYVPSKADETAGYTYKAQIKVLQPNGQNKNTYVVLTKTDKTYNGTPIYSLSLTGYSTITRLTIQTYNDTTWKSQVIIANDTTTGAMTNKMYDKDTSTLTDYTVDK